MSVFGHVSAAFSAPLLPPGLDCVHCAESQLLWGTLGKLGSAQQPAHPSHHHAIQCSAGGWWVDSPGLECPPPAEAPLQEESASACPAVDLGCRLRNSAPAVCPDRGMKAEGAAVQRRPLRASLIMEAVY